MAELTLPVVIELTDEEQKLADSIEFDIDGRTPQESIRASCKLAAELMELIEDRRAIPEIRRRYFIDPELNIGTKKSRFQVFESNGTSGDDLYRHPHFLKYIKYFIWGPDLPEKTIHAFCETVANYPGTSGMQLDELCRIARKAVRAVDRMDRKTAVEEIYKLALESGLDESTARIVRDGARTAANR